MSDSKAKPLGRTQKIAIGVLAAPFVISSVFVFAGKMTAGEWTAHIQFLALSVAVPFFGMGAAKKVLEKRADG